MIIQELMGEYRLANPSIFVILNPSAATRVALRTGYAQRSEESQQWKSSQFRRWDSSLAIRIAAQNDSRWEYPPFISERS